MLHKITWMLKHQNLPAVSSGYVVKHSTPPQPGSLSDLITFRMNLVLNMKAEEAKLEE